MTAALPAALVMKEGRALAPIWLASAISIVASAAMGMPFGGLFAFVLGAVALGVFSVGHEYAHRTLTMFLAQPISRSRLLISKLIVLAPLLALLTVVAAVTLLPAATMDWAFRSDAAGWRPAIFLLTPLLGLCVAPWLTMVCRSTVAGLVFTLAVPAALWIAGQIARATSNPLPGRSGFDIDPLAYAPGLTLMTAGILVVSVIAIVHGRSLFVGLEALETPRDLVPSRSQAHVVTVPAGSRHRASPGLRRSALAQLAYKEIRLQAPAFALAGLYALGWVALSVGGTERYIAGQSFAELTGMYGMFIALLVGAVSTAEERSLGTAQWQILQPVAFWKQWGTKMVTISMVALLLGLVVPMALEAAFPLIVDSGSVGPRLPLPLWFSFGAARHPSATILLVTLFSAYASTLAVGGLRALLVALALSFGLGSLYSQIVFAIFNLRLSTHSFSYQSVRVRFRWEEAWMAANWTDLRMADRLSDWINAATVGALIVAILYLCFRNSRSAEHPLIIARGQIIPLAAYVALAAVLAVGLGPVLEWWFLTH